MDHSARYIFVISTSQDIFSLQRSAQTSPNPIDSIEQTGERQYCPIDHTDIETDVIMKTESLQKFIPATGLILSLALTGATAASASAAQHSKGVAASEAADIDLIETLDAQSIHQVNTEIAAVGGAQLPSDTVAFGFNDTGDAVAVDAAGNETILESAASMNEALEAPSPSPSSLPTASGAMAASAESDKGVLTGLAATLAGCGGSVIGYDAILSILEKRVSYWALVKFLGSKVGPGIAISCIAGAGGALATYMGW
ncbi:hypothetical protein [Kocuria sp.]|uniref:hypothetical protein n=1 Tax=Kocuria sp. TaxID=1871328 RepID=UPI0026DF6A2C|nr:hypothetical protein [Kocuria sp.]MDO5618852.1 hypothetical protein [Kocuria sp.]